MNEVMLKTLLNVLHKTTTDRQNSFTRQHTYVSKLKHSSRAFTKLMSVNSVGSYVPLLKYLLTSGSEIQYGSKAFIVTRGIESISFNEMSLFVFEVGRLNIKG